MCFGGKAFNRRDGGMAETPENGNGRGKKRVAGKPAARQTVAKVKSTIHLSVEASQRLDIHATMMGLDRSALVEKLISDHLRRFVVSDRGGTADTANEDAAA
jgi:hypothetical protein